MAAAPASMNVAKWVHKMHGLMKMERKEDIDQSLLALKEVWKQMVNATRMIVARRKAL